MLSMAWKDDGEHKHRTEEIRNISQAKNNRVNIRSSNFHWRSNVIISLRSAQHNNDLKAKMSWLCSGYVLKALKERRVNWCR